MACIDAKNSATIRSAGHGARAQGGRARGEFDVNGDGLIDFDEFCAIVAQSVRLSGMALAEALAALRNAHAG